MSTPNPSPCDCTNCNTGSTRLAELFYEPRTDTRHRQATARVCREHSYSSGAVLHAVTANRPNVVDPQVDAADPGASVDLVREYGWDPRTQPVRDGLTWSWTWGRWTLRVTTDANRSSDLP